MRDRKDLIGPSADSATPVRYDPGDGDGGHPLVATIVGVIFLLLTSGSGSRETFGSGVEGQAEMLGYLTGSVVAGAAIVWGIAYAITIRKASTGWKIGSLIAISIASILSTAIKMSGDGSAAFIANAADIRNQMEEVARNPKSAGETRFQAGSGPMSRMSAAMLNPLLADSAAYEEEMQTAGLVQVVSFEGLTKKSPVLGRCGGLDRLADRATHYRSRWGGHVAAATAIGREAVRAGEMPAEGMRGFESGVRDGGGNIDRQWELNRLIATEAGAICRILARRNWDKPGAAVLFRNNGDLEELNAHAAKVDAYAAEAERIRARSNANLQAWAGKGAER